MKCPPKLVFLALFTCIFLGIFNEVLLAPFYPQFFRKVFGITDLNYTGYYIFLCRLTVVIFAPIWGLLSRYIEVKYLLYFGQAMAAIMTALMGTSTTVNQFLTYTLILLVFKSSYSLVYPLIIKIAGRARQGKIIGTHQAVLHGAMIISTITGASIIELDNPLNSFYVIALFDVVQLIIALYALQRISSKGSSNQKKSNSKNEKDNSINWLFLLVIGIIVCSFQLANKITLPYFTEYVTTTPFEVNIAISSLLVSIPSIIAISAAPYISKVCSPSNLNTVYLWGMGLLATSLCLQGWTNSIIVFLIGRIVYGFCLAISHAALEMKLFSKSSSQDLNFNFSIAFAFANIGNLGSPLIASESVNRLGLPGQFFAAAFISGLNIYFSRLFIFRKEKTASLKANQ